MCVGVGVECGGGKEAVSREQEKASQKRLESKLKEWFLEQRLMGMQGTYRNLYVPLLLR